LVLMSADLVERIVKRLRPYVLRAKVEFASSEPSAWIAAPLSMPQAAQLLQQRSAELPDQLPAQLPTQPGSCVTIGSNTLLRWWSHDERYLLLAPRTAHTLIADDTVDLAWRRANIAAGLPQLSAPTYESFIAQMLNLDLLGGISFDKGCYTGQEIIARTHYRGSVKRRLFRFASASTQVPAPGSQVMKGSSQVGEVVDAVATDTGCELLAVVAIDATIAATKEQATAELTIAADNTHALTVVPLPYVSAE
jgi:tRNA-modifying protein YgfZ